MSNFFISCKESRIENNRSFYGCFYLGPFEPSQSLTLANTLRRTLLSEIYGLAIVSVEIEGAAHEYSSLPGVRESVLDILLNLKEIVLKKTVKNFTPQIGYLRARGPGVVSAAHLKLPPFIQSVDPDQYIANLSHNGFLNMKFIIQYGNKWLSSGMPIFQNYTDPVSFSRESQIALNPINSSKSLEDFNETVSNLVKIEEDKTIEGSVNEGLKDAKTRLPMTYNIFNLYFKKRRLFLKKLKEIGILESNSYINLFSKNVNFLSKYKKKREIVLTKKTKENLNLILKIHQKYPGINLKTGPLLSKSYFGLVSKKNKKKLIDSNNKSLGLLHMKKQVKSLKKGNKKMISKKLLIPVEDLKIDNSITSKQNSLILDNSIKNEETKNLNRQFIRSNSKLNKKKMFFNINPLNIEAIFNPISKINYIIEINDLKIAQTKLQNSFKTSEVYEILQNLSVLKENSLVKTNSIINKDFENLLQLNHEINALTKETIKHNIILEIWTNGSIHPRDALFQAFKHIIKIFTKLNKVQPFTINTTSLNSNSLEKITEIRTIESEKALINVKESNSITSPTFLHQKDKISETISLLGNKKLIASQKEKIIKRQFKSTFLQNLHPLNETCFLSTYISPKIKNYYLNKRNLSIFLQAAIETNLVEPISIPEK
jgi:DNA-directed RNA polymerase alpha subunit